ncbi:MAG: FAD-dependent oxidoreductase [Thomasclavelia ramosa]
MIVVGGGPAGCKAAITAHYRGHQVILIEQRDKLGDN